MYPQPELAFLVRVQGQVICLAAVPLEEAGQRLAGVHDPEEPGVVDQLLVPVRIRCRRRDVAIGNIGEQFHELLVCLRPEAAENAGLIQRAYPEPGRRHLALAHRFVVRHIDAMTIDLGIGTDEPWRLWPSQLVDGIDPEFLPDAQRQRDQRQCLAGVLHRQPHGFQLDHGLAESEAGEERSPTAADAPADKIALVRLQEGMDLVGVDLEAT